MGDFLELPVLYVEGKDDLHTIRHLLARHGIALDEHLGPVRIQDAKNDRGVLDSMRTAARASTNRHVGFVVDVDIPVTQRWQSARDRLKDLGVPLPEAAPESGFVGDSSTTKARVGVWIMPDNVMDQGRLEDLLKTLVPPGDILIDHARASTDKAVARGAQFPPQHRLKAELHCWLAWQKEPGLPFGTAIKAHFFRHDSDVALRFVAWFRRLYALP